MPLYCKVFLVFGTIYLFVFNDYFVIMQIILRLFLSDLSDDIRIELENKKKAVTEMEKEFELVAHPQIHAFRALLVRLFSRAPHTHREMEIGLVLDGNPQLTVNGTIRNLQSGDIYLLNPMELHEIHGQSGGALILAIQMSRQLVTSYFQHDENTCFIENSVRSFFSQHETRYEIMKGLLIELAYNYFGQFANYEYKCMSLLNMILYALHTYVPKKTYTDAEITTRRHRQERMSRITDHIEKNFRQKLLLRDIAAHENLSLTYLSHLFRDELDLSFQEYLNLKRFEYACRLLQHTDKKVLTISIESGFSDVRYLNQLCQKYYGCPASELRGKTRLPAATDKQVSSNTQNIFTPGDSILLLHTLRENYQDKYSSYTIWEFYR